MTVKLRRAISLVPSATDTLVALGAGGALVAISSDCDQPDPGRPLPVVTGAMIDPGAIVDAAEIDSAVRSQLAAGGSLYRLYDDNIVGLAPEVVFAQDQCAVCAVPSGEVSAALLRHGLSCEVVSLDPVGLDDVLSTFATIGRAVGAGEAGEALEASCRRRLRDLRHDELLAAVRPRRPRVLVLDWVDPPFAAGNWVPELVEAAGGEAVVVGAGEAGEAGEAGIATGPIPSRQVTVEDVVAARPDVVVVAPCGLGLDESTRAAGEVRGWFDSGPAGVLNAESDVVPRGRRQSAEPSVPGAGGSRGVPRVIAFDGRIWFSRPGPRLVEGAEALSALLAGELLPPSAGGCCVVEITEDPKHDRTDDGDSR